MSPITIDRFSNELLGLHHDFGIALTPVTEKQLLDHLETYSKNHETNSYRIHFVMIKHALRMACLNREDLTEEVILPRRMAALSLQLAFTPTCLLCVVTYTSDRTATRASEVQGNSATLVY